MSLSQKCRPREHLESVGRRYPGAWEAVEHLRAGRGADLPDWPDWCYIPIAGVQAIVANDAGINVAMLGVQYPERIADAARLAALSTWRMTQGIYRFDPAVYEPVRETPVANDIPHELLLRLPEWCVYVETPGLQIGDAALQGIFAHLEHDVNNGRRELRLLLDTDELGGMMLTPMALHLGPWSLAESVSRAVDVASASAIARGATAIPREHVNTMRACIEPVISLLLYVCTQASDITGRNGAPGNPKPVKTRRHGWRVYSADGPRTWDVGVRLGAALRLAYAAQQSGQPQPGSTRSSVRGHIRRSHWHAYLSGPRMRDGVPIPSLERTTELRWMPPIAVALDSLDGLAATVRPVQPTGG